MSVKKKQLLILRQVNYDLFGGDEIQPALNYQLKNNACSIEKNITRELPSLEELYRKFDDINTRIFNNQLPHLKIKYSERMLTAGSFVPNINEIRIGRKYHSIFPEEIEDTLAHEMMHYIYPDHGAQFKLMAGRFGISLKAKEHPDLRSRIKYLYYCPSCGKEYPRRKRLRLASCGTCTRGKIFNPEFKLILRKSK